MAAVGRGAHWQADLARHKRDVRPLGRRTTPRRTAAPPRLLSFGLRNAVVCGPTKWPDDQGADPFVNAGAVDICKVV